MDHTKNDSLKMRTLVELAVCCAANHLSCEMMEKMH